MVCIPAICLLFLPILAVASTINVAEFFAPALNHFFITADSTEQAVLDAGRLKGWDRTDFAFAAYGESAPGRVPVCRFFGTDAYRADGTRIGPSSHFYTSSPTECDFVKTAWSERASDGKLYPAWSFEGIAFYVIPASADGSCPLGSTAIYRVYNNGENGEPNHRFVEDVVQRDSALMSGWISEGTAWCAPILVPPKVRPRVRVVYAFPTDYPFRQDYANAMRLAHADLADWYRDEVGAKTFHLKGPTPERCPLPNVASYYLVDSWTKVIADIASCGVYLDSATIFVIYTDVLHACNASGRLGAGTNGIAILPRQDLQGLLGQQVMDDCGVAEPAFTASRWIGGLGHEMGHTFGLPHPPGCEQNLESCDVNALMWAGYATWPATYLRDDEKAILLASPYFY
jgi:hypothetical protein